MRLKEKKEVLSLTSDYTYTFVFITTGFAYIFNECCILVDSQLCSFIY